jgi:nucleoside-diphosphate-sugar epimerase
MAGSTVLLTGGTGFVGSSILRMLLEDGHQVRAVVRTAASVQKLATITQSIGKPDLLSFVTVPDFCAPGAFDEAVKDIEYIIHTASPIPFNLSAEQHEDWEQSLVQPAVQGTLGIFESAKKADCVRRIVVTSSLAAQLPVSLLSGQTSEPLTSTSREPDMVPPYPDHVIAYMASKRAALSAAERWTRDGNASFDVIHIHPAYVFGHDHSAITSAAYETGSNLFILAAAHGRVSPELPGLHAIFTDVEDNARVHVDALSPGIPGNRSFIVSSSGHDGSRWEDVPDLVAKHFLQHVDRGVFPRDPTRFKTFPADVRAADTDAAFEIQWKTFEDIVKSTLGHYIELLESEAGNGSKSVSNESSLADCA